LNGTERATLSEGQPSARLKRKSRRGKKVTACAPVVILEKTAETVVALDR
jgi:hypothetical protein